MIYSFEPFFDDIFLLKGLNNKFISGNVNKRIYSIL